MPNFDANQQESKKHRAFFKLQFIDLISMEVRKEIREFLRLYDIKLIMSHRSFAIEKLVSYKDRQSLIHSSGVVHRLPSSCAQNLIGKTKRNLITTRFSEHQGCKDYEVYKHLLNNPNNEINFNSPKIFDRSNQVAEFGIKETLHPRISKTELQLNVVFNLCPCIFFSTRNCFKLTSLYLLCPQLISV